MRAEVDYGKQIIARTEFVRSRWRVGASLLYNDTDVGDRTGAGVFGAFNLGPVTLLGEVDYFDDDSIGRRRSSWRRWSRPTGKCCRGTTSSSRYEWLEPNDDVDEDEQTRTSLLYEWSPIQFVQLRAGVRVYDGIPQNDNQNRKQAFLQLHGFF